MPIQAARSNPYTEMGSEDVTPATSSRYRVEPRTPVGGWHVSPTETQSLLGRTEVSISSDRRRTRRTFCLSLSAFLVMAIGIAFICYPSKLSRKQDWEMFSTFSPMATNTVRAQAWLTSKSSYPSSAMQEMNLENLQSIEPGLRGLYFNNAKCGVNHFSSGEWRCHGLTTVSTVSRMHVASKQQHQRIVGFGGAFTESSGQVYSRLPKEAKEKVLNSYFGPGGAGYSLCRMHINSCDFSRGGYSYDDVEEDWDLKHFDNNLTPDQRYVLPMIRDAMEILAKNSKAPKTLNGTSIGLRMIASPWSPPAWMKRPIRAIHQEAGKQYIHVIESSNATCALGMDHSAAAAPTCLRADERVYKVWSDYLVRTVKSLRQLKVPIWALTVQNEPEFNAPWEACEMTSLGQRQFIDDYLGPALKASGLRTLPTSATAATAGGDETINGGQVKLLAFDHNKDHLLHWAQVMLEPSFEWKRYNLTAEALAADEDDKNFSPRPVLPLSADQKATTPASEVLRGASPYVDGMAFHWYGGLDRLTDGTYGYEAVRSVAAMAPDTLLLNTEGCSCPGVWRNDWFRAERHAHDVLFDLQSGAHGWIDWNLLLDYTGGYNHAGNVCDAPLLATPDESSVHVQPKFWYMSHFSRFLTPSSVRLGGDVVGDYSFTLMEPGITSNSELAIHHCERSTRQVWAWNPLDNTLRLTTVTHLIRESPPPSASLNATTAESQSDSDDTLVQLCVSKGDSNRPYLRLADCGNSSEHRSDLVRLVKEDNGHFRDVDTSMCITVLGSNGRDSPEVGSLLALFPCEIDAHTGQAVTKQHFVHNSQTGELKTKITTSSTVDANQLGSKAQLGCLTAGWPFLNGISFLRPDGQTAVVITNEASASVVVAITDDYHNGQALAVPIPPRSIVSLMYSTPIDDKHN